MRSMVWHPEEKDAKVNNYLEQANHPPYRVVAAVLLAVFCSFTVLVLIGSF